MRYGRSRDASIVALPLAPDNRRVLVAAPAYLERCGTPQALDNLKGHSCVLWQMQGRAYDKWVLPAGKTRRIVQVKGALACDDADVGRRWTLDGEGVSYRSWLDVATGVRAGRLRVVLPDQQGEPAPLQMVCPHRRQFSPAVRRLHALLAERCAALAP